jgi:hypothetical protein
MRTLVSWSQRVPPQELCGAVVMSWADALGFDMSTAEGYRRWRAGGGIWPDETFPRLAAYAEAKDVSEHIDAGLAGEEAGNEEAA